MSARSPPPTSPLETRLRDLSGRFRRRNPLPRMPMELFAKRDRQPDRRLRSMHLDQVKRIRRNKHPIAGPHPNRLVVPFEAPRKLALINVPALVLKMVMPVVLMARTLAYRRDDEPMIGDQLRMPRRRPVRPNQLIDPDRKPFAVENRMTPTHQSCPPF